MLVFSSIQNKAALLLLTAQVDAIIRGLRRVEIDDGLVPVCAVETHVEIEPIAHVDRDDGASVTTAALRDAGLVVDVHRRDPLLSEPVMASMSNFRTMQ